MIPMPVAVLAVGEETRFCEMDSDLAHRVDRLNCVPTAMEGERGLREVTVITRFDPETAAPWRPGDLALVPGPRRAALGLVGGPAVPPALLLGADGRLRAFPLGHERRRLHSGVFQALPPVYMGG